MSETFTTLSAEMRGTFTCWCVTGAQIVLILQDSGITAVRHAGSGAAMPGDGAVREVADVVAWPRVGEKLQLRFGDGDRLTSTEVSRIARFEALASVRMRIDQEPGRDLESRAQLYRVVMAAPPLLAALEALSPEASARIGWTPERMRALELLFSRALWSSTADLNQAGEFDFAHQVTARAAELAEEKGQRP